ncbi:hypothetical protein [Actinoplanes sp. OR16]|nr:hypothetical protein [Actinoplanes sp. OR16]
MTEFAVVSAGSSRQDVPDAFKISLAGAPVGRDSSNAASNGGAF